MRSHLKKIIKRILPSSVRIRLRHLYAKGQNFYKTSPYLNKRFQKIQERIGHLGLIFKYLQVADWPSALIHYFQNSPMWLMPKNINRVYQLHEFLAKICEHQKKHIASDLYEWEVNGKKIVATMYQYQDLLSEYFTGEYNRLYSGPWQGKRILDLGGFVGDSALFFLQQGAKRVVAYEPVPINIEAMKHNLQEFCDQTEIHEKALHHSSEPTTIFSSFPPGTLGFGLKGQNYEIECLGITFLDLLQQHSVDMIKIDIEGAEEFLLDVPSEELKKIPYWIIETHNADLGEKITTMFGKLGYTATKKLTVAQDVDLYHFVFN